MTTFGSGTFVMEERVRTEKNGEEEGAASYGSNSGAECTARVADKITRKYCDESAGLESSVDIPRHRHKHLSSPRYERLKEPRTRIDRGTKIGGSCSI